MKRVSLGILGLAASAFAGGAQAQSMGGFAPDSGRLLLTGGVTTVEGAAGGGLAPWAVIAGYGTRDSIGGTGFGTFVGLDDFEFRGVGVAVGFADRVEVSYARQAFDTRSAGAALGLGKGFTFHQDVIGVKVKLVGDAVYDQDSWMPQVSVGAQYKNNDKDGVVRFVGAKKDEGVDFYVAATKVLLDQSLVLSGAVRMTKANQIGILGFGGDKHDNYRPQFEGSVGYLLSKRLVVGGEYRTKPSNLGFAKEDDWFDIFAAYAINKNLSVTVAYANLGDIATFKNQDGVYVSLQAGF